MGFTFNPFTGNFDFFFKFDEDDIVIATHTLDHTPTGISNDEVTTVVTDNGGDVVII
jgi:hypothetical protein